MGINKQRFNLRKTRNTGKPRMIQHYLQLLKEAYQLKNTLHLEWLEMVALEKEVKNSFDTWLKVQTKCNKLGKLVDLAQKRCNRRSEKFFASMMINPITK